MTEAAATRRHLISVFLLVATASDIDPQPACRAVSGSYSRSSTPMGIITMPLMTLG